LIELKNAPGAGSDFYMHCARSLTLPRSPNSKRET
jgi:hypothetical protein